ncbi:glycerol-3-phosphate acyltransferase [Bacillus licheniformis]|nr:glycerol-3-phosphate acyltransferase [Bacillus licheniformis]
MKGTLAAFLPAILHIGVHPLLAGVAAVIGHMFPVFANLKAESCRYFRRRIACYQPLLFLTMVAVFFLFCISQICIAFFHFNRLVYNGLQSVYERPLLVAVVAFLTAFVVYRHRTNIKRIIDKPSPNQVDVRQR